MVGIDVEPRGQSICKIQYPQVAGTDEPNAGSDGRPVRDFHIELCPHRIRTRPPDQQKPGTDCRGGTRSAGDPARRRPARIGWRPPLGRKGPLPALLYIVDRTI